MGVIVEYGLFKNIFVKFLFAIFMNFASQNSASINFLKFTILYL